MSTRTKPKIIL